MKEFYHQSVTEVRKQVNGSMKPLTDQQVAEHQKEYGMNELTEGKKRVLCRYFWSSTRISWLLF